MLVKIQGPNLQDQSKGCFHVHAADCSDNHKYLENSFEVPIEVESKLDCEDHVYGPAAGDFDIETPGDWMFDFHFLPCTKGLPYGDPVKMQRSWKELNESR